MRRSVRELEAQGLAEVEHTGRGGINRVRITEAGIALDRKLQKQRIGVRRRVKAAAASEAERRADLEWKRRFAASYRAALEAGVIDDPGAHDGAHDAVPP